MTTARFDVYAICINCGLELSDSTTAQQHMDETMGPELDGIAVSHRIKLKSPNNPTRQSRARAHIASIIDDAVMETIDRIDGLIDAGDITEAEARKHYTDTRTSAPNSSTATSENTVNTARPVS